MLKLAVDALDCSRSQVARVVDYVQPVPAAVGSAESAKSHMLKEMPSPDQSFQLEENRFCDGAGSSYRV
jgi:hypothetical protein